MVMESSSKEKDKCVADKMKQFESLPPPSAALTTSRKSSSHADEPVAVLKKSTPKSNSFTVASLLRDHSPEPSSDSDESTSNHDTDDLQKSPASVSLSQDQNKLMLQKGLFAGSPAELAHYHHMMSNSLFSASPPWLMNSVRFPQNTLLNQLSTPDSSFASSK